MTIWVLAVILLLLCGGLGYAKGAVRMTCSLVGVLLGAVLAAPLAPLIRPVVPLVGLKNPVWSVLLPPVLVFFLISTAFLIVGFVVHRQVNLYFKYRTDDFQRLSWERLNKRIGISLGLAAGVAYTLIIGLAIYILGYLTVQVSAGDSDPALVRYLNQARADLQKSGLEKALAALDPAPENYYLAADVMGLVYHNRLLHGRLSGYPAFLSLAERQEFQDLATDADYQNLFSGGGTVAQLINHPKTQAILGNKEIVGQLEQTDLKDLRDYLQTGESAKYGETEILGRWQLDPYFTLQQQKRRRTRMTTAEMKALRLQAELMKGFILVAGPDNNVRLKGPDVGPIIRRYVGDAGRPAPGRRSGGGNTPSPGQLANEAAQLPVVALAQGNWSGDGTRYELSMQAESDGFRFDGGRRSAKIEASVRDGMLHLSQENETWVMARF